MNKEEIIKEFDERIKKANELIERINRGEQDKYLRTKKARETVKNFQYGFINGMKIAKDYLENYLK